MNGKKKAVVDILKKNLIETGIHYKPNHLLSLYSGKKKYKLPTTEQIYSETITLPLHPNIKTSDILKISNLIKKVLI